MLLRLFTIVPWILAAGLAAQAAFAQPKKNPNPKQLAPRPDAFSVVERFERMTPQQRQRFLGKLPPERKQQFEDRLDRYERMTPEQRQQVREQYELFQGLPKERQDALRRAFRQFNELPAGRRRVLRREYQRLRQLAGEGRRARINSDEFRNRYNLAEQQLLDDLAKLLPPPAPDSASR
ncbi:MAG: DUF3106 domain-containing protein [Bryobacterales bacterium]|nr:DUF3106 domain-containing protein [Bryobacterales bacterium]